MDLNQLTLEEAAEGLRKKKFSSVELTQNCLDKIQEKEKNIFSFLKVTAEKALAQAKEADQVLAEGGEESKLAGIPLAVKDNILLKDVSCTAGSRILENYTAPYDATVISRLKKRKAVFLGKTNLDEFAMGSSTENSAFQVTHNPYDLKRVPGGSSGGSAAAVGSGEAIYSLGSETGGSVRQPASFCGLVGLKTTYGSVSRYGLIALASSLDQIGPITKTVGDSRLVFQAISGPDKKDATSRQKENFSSFSLKSLKVGLIKDELLQSVDPLIVKRIKRVVDELKGKGAKVKTIDFPNLLSALPTYYIIVPAEASANLARYDGIKYGKSATASDLEKVYRLTRGEGFGPEVKRRIILGTFVLSAGYAEAYYKRALKIKRLIVKELEKAFQEVDVIISPTTPTLPFKIGEKTQDPVQMYLSDLLTVPANLAGLPALTVPVGTIQELPVGLQIMAPAFQEERLFQVGEEIEKLASFI